MTHSVVKENWEKDRASAYRIYNGYSKRCRASSEELTELPLTEELNLYMRMAPCLGPNADYQTFEFEPERAIMRREWH
jgi:hypothetical protein